ncbi:hypothetical protein SanaruYs_05820 [Chryseotalea sanaruensis]|uniref:Outer membrane protein beta-barrel domain-containing protein n=2 Tax=Chryseotalea sanaruensis TaxID=2482724 RepID=A0A401U661_9BACT|nr:hypothetical protein SanaruYs_05820 [Chryseotalea sanaruensis]
MQAQTYGTLEYVVAMPLQDMKDYINKTSFRGIAFDYQHKIDPKLSVGLNVGLSLFYEKKSYATYIDGTSSISGIQYRYLSAIPIYAGGIYFLNEDTRMNPFVGFYIGTTYTIRDTDMGLYRWQEENWSFSMRPEAGVIFKPVKTFAIKVSLRYNEVFRTESMGNQSFLAIVVGLVIIK